MVAITLDAGPIGVDYFICLGWSGRGGAAIGEGGGEYERPASSGPVSMPRGAAQRGPQRGPSGPPAADPYGDQGVSDDDVPF